MSTIKTLARELDDLEVEFAAELEALKARYASRFSALAAKLRATEASLGKAGKVAYIGNDGRLTPAGVRYCEAAFANKRTPTEIARELGVTVPAIVVRRQKWLASHGGATSAKPRGLTLKRGGR